MTISHDMIAYYSRRAEEYEGIYNRQALRSEYATLQRWMRDALEERDVLELACGTGYWTRPVGEAARLVVATDVNEEVLAIAQKRTHARGNVRFANVDAFDLTGAALTDTPLTGALAAFGWSHVPLDRRHDFLRSLHAQLSTGAVVVLFDNHYVEGVSTPMSRRDEAGNTYQMRRLDDGGVFEIVKNYPSEDELVTMIEPFAAAVTYKNLKHFWFVRYSTA